MGMINNLMRNLVRGHAAKRSWTPAEARELIARGELDRAGEAIDKLAEDTPNRDLLLLCLRGELAFRDHRDTDAEKLFRDALALAPGLCDAHYGLSIVMLARAEPEAALRHAQFAVNTGRGARFSAQLGLCHLELGNFSRAGSALTRATRLEPSDKASWNNLGIARRAKGDLYGAQISFKRALEIDPDFERAANNLKMLLSDAETFGIDLASPPPSRTNASPSEAGFEDIDGLEAAGELSAAIEACEQLCLDRPDESAPVIKLYRLYRAQGDTQNGLDALEAFRSRHPDDLDALKEHGIALIRENEFKQAKPLVTQALEARPDDVDLLVAMSDIRFEQDRFAESGELLERAFALDQSLHMKGKLAANLHARCRYEEALKLVDEMLAEQPAVAEDVMGVRVYALTQLGRHDEALPMLDESIAKQPNDPNRRFPRATIHLLNERFGEGWDDYAYRALSSTRHLRMVPFPLWRGEPLEGKTLLVLAEQGLGDQVMFASCLPDVVALRPARTVVEVVDRVAPTIARSFPECEVVATKQDAAFDWVRKLGHVDYFVPMGDLPQRFRRSHADFPRHTGYLRAAPERVAHWRTQLAALGGRPKIGVSWRGGTELTRQGLRTLDVTMLRPLADRCDADWVCLQYGEVKDDLAKAAEAGMPMHHWPESIRDLDEFAALITALDLVVTVCNTTVHYAGAVGREVWVLTPKVPEWRYGLHSTVLPWYPSSRLYRQADAGDWQHALARIGQDLSERFPRS
mgnify:CR=1 FL=1